MSAVHKAGIIGTGFIGPVHVEAARRLGNVEFIALAEANQQLADEKAAALRRLAGQIEMILNPPVDNVTELHAET